MQMMISETGLGRTACKEEPKRVPDNIQVLHLGSGLFEECARAFDRYKL